MVQLQIQKNDQTTAQTPRSTNQTPNTRKHQQTQQIQTKTPTENQKRKEKAPHRYDYQSHQKSKKTSKHPQISHTIQKQMQNLTNDLRIRRQNLYTPRRHSKRTQ